MDVVLHMMETLVTSKTNKIVAKEVIKKNTPKRGNSGGGKRDYRICFSFFVLPTDCRMCKHYCINEEVCVALGRCIDAQMAQHIAQHMSHVFTLNAFGELLVNHAK